MNLKNRINNFILCFKYPFLIPRNVWTGKKCDYFYSFTELDKFPNGWRKAFGIKFCEDLKKALSKLSKKSRKEFRILDIKEKWGILSISTNFVTEEIDEVLFKYEGISVSTCIHCGNKAEYESKGWISPYCEKCIKELNIKKYKKITS